ncbi:hypothetical protein D3C72_2120990 [compost metagenome]
MRASNLATSESTYPLVDRCPLAVGVPVLVIVPSVLNVVLAVVVPIPNGRNSITPPPVAAPIMVLLSEVLLKKIPCSLSTVLTNA